LDQYIESEEMNKNYIFYALVFGLVLLSFLKDQITPDYLNSEHAAFLKTLSTGEVLKSHITAPLFWLLAYSYSIVFILLPYLIINLKHNQKSAKILLFILVGLAITEYTLIFINDSFLYKLIVPKINRYLHSPYILFFSFLILKLQQNNTIKN
jgi:hypothetical protein